MGMSQICAGACDYFRPSKPHSGKLWLIINNTTDLLRVFFLLSLVVEIKYHYSMTRKTSCMDGLVSPIIIEMQNVSPNILTDNDYYWEWYRYDAIVALLRVKSWPGSSSSQDRYRIEYRLQSVQYTDTRRLETVHYNFSCPDPSVYLHYILCYTGTYTNKLASSSWGEDLALSKIVMKTLNFTFNATVEESKRWSLYNILNCWQ